MNKRRLKAYSTEPMRLPDNPSVEQIADAYNKLLQQQHEFNKAMCEQADAQSGIRGTVISGKQKHRDSRKLDLPSHSFEGGRAADCDDPVDPMDVVNLRTLQRLLKCSNLVRILENCEDFEDLLGAAGTGEDDDDSDPCKPFELNDGRRVASGLTVIRDVKVLNEFIYVIGE